MTKQKISIVIPAYNEESFIGPLLEKILKVNIESFGFAKEIIVVDDGSSDRTVEIVEAYKEVVCIAQENNQGKGRAVQRGINEATGDFILVQDADLEYDPDDYLQMLDALAKNEKALVYGSRILGQIQQAKGFCLFPGKHPEQKVKHWLAGVVLSLWTYILYGCWISDTLTAYKLYPTKEMRDLNIKTFGFETDHELTAKFRKAGFSIIEVPIRYYPRSIEEGKKIRARDGFTALWVLLKYRFTD